MRTPAPGRSASSGNPSGKGRPGRASTPASGRASPGRTSRTPSSNNPALETRPSRSGSRGLIISGIIVLCLLAGGGAFLGVTLKKASDANRVTESLKQATYYEDKGEYEEALKILNGLDIDNPKVKQLLDDVLAKKKTADDAERQQELSALLAQQQQLRAGLNELGAKLNQPQKIVIQQPPEKTAPEKGPRPAPAGSNGFQRRSLHGGTQGLRAGRRSGSGERQCSRLCWPFLSS
jgi:uncharacterized membrane protein YvbJ